MTGGEYFHANDREELARIYALLDGLNPRQVETTSHRPRTELYSWPLGIALVSSMMFYLPGTIGRRHRVPSEPS